MKSGRFCFRWKAVPELYSLMQECQTGLAPQARSGPWAFMQARSGLTCGDGVNGVRELLGLTQLLLASLLMYMDFGGAPHPATKFLAFLRTWGQTKQICKQFQLLGHIFDTIALIVRDNLLIFQSKFILGQFILIYSCVSIVLWFK